MSDCIFCKIVSGELPNATIYEDEHVLSFLSISPVVEGHALVIPKNHAQTLPELSPVDLVHVSQIVRKVDAKLREHFNCDAVSVWIRDGPAAGQEIPHLHVHLIPRFDGDNLGPAYHEGEQADMNDLSSLSSELFFD